jgi:glutaminyl-peptide cyclotransferase
VQTMYQYIKPAAILLIAGIAVFTSACNSPGPPVPPVAEKPAVVVNYPDFNADTAFYFTEKQLGFGPRVPNTAGHETCGNWLVAAAKSFADTVFVQPFVAGAFDGKKLKGRNIIASFNPAAARRILLCAHWDTRPFADQDTVDRGKPIAGANDGAGGVAILMEVARAVRASRPGIGVDIMFIDVEDYGQPQDSEFPPMEDSYCLGSQHWAKQPHVPGYKADFGILLDMASARGAVFTREGTSARNAGWVQDRVWANAGQIGFSNFFNNTLTGGIIDDHKYIMEITGIPMVDIIHFDASTHSGFGWYWHTHRDAIETVDKTTMLAVGKTVLYTVYQYDAESKAQ